MGRAAHALALLVMLAVGQVHAASALPFFGKNKTLATPVTDANITLHQLADLANKKQHLLFDGVNALGAKATEAEKAVVEAKATAETAALAALRDATSGNKTAKTFSTYNVTTALKGETGLAAVSLPVSVQSALGSGGAGGGDITCYEDETTGAVAGWSQGGVTTCRTTSKAVTIPLAGSYINGIKVAKDKRTGAIGRLVFEVVAQADATKQYVKPKYYYCGSAGGLYAKELLPSNSALAAFAGQCASASGRRLMAAPGTVDPAKTLVVSAPLDPRAGPPPAGVRLVRTLADAVSFVVAHGGSVPSTILAAAEGEGYVPPSPPPPPPAPSAWRFGNTRLDGFGMAWGLHGLTLLTLLSQDPPTLAVSQDGGKSFTTYHSELTDSLAVNQAYTGALAVSVDAQVMYAGVSNWVNATGGVDALSTAFQNGRLLKSNDGGLSFQPLDLGNGNTIRSADYVQTDVSGQHVLVGATEYAGSYVDYDAGTDMAGLRTTWLFEPSGPNTAAIYYSSNSGASFTRSVLGSGNVNETQALSGDVISPLQLSNDGTVIYSLVNTLVVTDVNGTQITQQGDVVLQYSSDGGQSWTPAARSSDKYWVDYAVGGLSGKVVVAILVDDNYDYHVLLSKNRGVSWSEIDISSVLPASTALTNAVVSATGTTIAISTDTGIIASADQGVTWEVVPVPEDEWLLAGVEDGVGGSKANLFAWDTNDHLWTPYGPGTTIEDPAVVSNANFAVARKKPGAAAALAAHPPEASSIVTSTKITVDMAQRQAAGLSPDLVQRQLAAMGLASNGTVADGSPAQYSIIKHYAEKALAWGCTQVSVCNGALSGLTNWAVQKAGPLCADGFIGGVVNTAFGIFADIPEPVSVVLGFDGNVCPNAPNPLQIVADAEQAVVDFVATTVTTVVNAAVNAVRTFFDFVGSSLFPTVKIYQPQFARPGPPISRIPQGKPCMYKPGAMGWIPETTQLRPCQQGKRGLVCSVTSYKPGCDNVRTKCCTALVDGTCYNNNPRYCKGY